MSRYLALDIEGASLHLVSATVRGRARAPGKGPDLARCGRTHHGRLRRSRPPAPRCDARGGDRPRTCHCEHRAGPVGPQRGEISRLGHPRRRAQRHPLPGGSGVDGGIGSGHPRLLPHTPPRSGWPEAPPGIRPAQRLDDGLQGHLRRGGTKTFRHDSPPLRHRRFTRAGAERRRGHSQPE